MDPATLPPHATRARTEHRTVGRPARRPVPAPGPNWFAAVMGTGIVANAAILLPRHVPGLAAVALAAWLAAAGALVVLTTLTVRHWRRDPAGARAAVATPEMLPFLGAPPMALMTVGAGTLLVGGAVVGDAAVPVAAALWTLGTVGGLAAAAAGPYVLFTRHAAGAARISPTWLLPVVPPMVSAATGAALVAHVPAGQARATLLLVLLALFGIGVIASLVTITLVWGRLATGGPGAEASAPALFVVLGPLGQSVTAAGLLAAAAPAAAATRHADAFRLAAVAYGVPVWGFALLWLVLASALVLRAARRGMPFSLSWWSFTFPVGTVVTGTSVLARQTGLDALAWLAVALYALLLVAWAVAAGRTLHGGLVTGARLRPA